MLLFLPRGQAFVGDGGEHALVNVAVKRPFADLHREDPAFFLDLG